MHIQITQSDRNYFDNVTNNGTIMGNFTHIVSIVCPDEKILITPISHRHTIVKMWDIDRELKNNFREYNPPSDAECMPILHKIKDFYISSVAKNEPMNLLVHCDAGISRSPAITLGIVWMLTDIFFYSTYKCYGDLYYSLRDYYEARKIVCASMVNDDSVSLKRYIEGRFNPGVKPNQAILKCYRKYFDDFPW